MLRGYEPSQVDQRTGELLTELHARRADVARLTGEVDQLRASLAAATTPLSDRTPTDDAGQRPAARAVTATTGPSPFAQLTERLRQILTLAEEEATEMVDRARESARAVREEGEASAAARRTDADRYDETVRADADIEVQRLLSEAHRQAVETVDSAHRDATARREEAEALWEAHRARAAQAAADVEVALTARRERAEEDFLSRSTAAEDQLDTVERAAAQAHLQSEREVADATARSHQMLSDARTEATRLVEEARERAERMRADSERELAAADHRRDSISIQLTNVRQMLATLSGSVPVTDAQAQSFLDDDAAGAQGSMDVDLRDHGDLDAPRR